MGLNLAFFGVSGNWWAAGLRGFGEGPDRGGRLHGTNARQEGGRHLGFAQRLSFFRLNIMPSITGPCDDSRSDHVMIHGRFLDSIGAVCGADWARRQAHKGRGGLH